VVYGRNHALARRGESLEDLVKGQEIPWFIK
jgi:hypothetical protein